MAFFRDGLSRNGSGTGVGMTIWSYTTLDAYATVSGANYFDDAIKELSHSDLIYVYDQTLDVMTLTYVTSFRSSAAVVIATGLTITA